MYDGAEGGGDDGGGDTYDFSDGFDNDGFENDGLGKGVAKLAKNVPIGKQGEFKKAIKNVGRETKILPDLWRVLVTLM